MRARLPMFICWVVLLTSAVGSFTLGSEPPDSEVNPQTGSIELVDSVALLSNREVRHVTNSGEGEPLAVVFVSNHPGDDNRPRIEIESDGDTWIVWWRAATDDEVWVRRRSHVAGAWQAPRRVSEEGENSRNPDVVHDASNAWIAYEVITTGGIEIAVLGIGEDPDPFPSRVVVSETSHGGDIDTRVHFASGHLWATWVDNAADVGFAEYDYTAESWSVPSYESYAQDDVQQARGRIRATVTGP